MKIKHLCLSPLFIPLLLGCAPLFQPKKQTDPDPTQFVGKPLEPEQAEEVLAEVGKGVAYGPGLGEVVLNGGTAILFPPYAAYLLGNAVLSLSGYEPISVSRMLPDEAGKVWGSTYNEVVSAPGRVTAAIAGEEFRNEELTSSSLQKILNSSPSPDTVKRTVEK